MILNPQPFGEFFQTQFQQLLRISEEGFELPTSSVYERRSIVYFV